VLQEAGALQEFLDREANVVKALAGLMFPDIADAFAAMPVENRINPYKIDDEKDRIERYSNATGGKAIMSQYEAIEKAGLSKNPQQTLDQIREDEQRSVFGAYE